MENWPGIAGAGPQVNASQVDIPPENLRPIWQRTFPALPIGDQSGPNNEMRFAAGKGSRNLTLVDGKIALIATESTDVPNGENDYYCTVLDAADGRALGVKRIQSSQGNNRAYRWPHYCVSASSDNVTGIVRTAWDPQTGIFFASQGAYLSSYTAWIPLKPEHARDAEPAYRVLAEDHPGLADAFGRTRADLKTVFGPQDKKDRLEPYTWGLSGLYMSPESAADKKKSKYDSDWLGVFEQQGSSYYNTSSVFSLDTNGPLIVQCKGAAWGHNSGGDAYVFSKHTGMKMVAGMPYPGDGTRLRPFTVGGALAANGRLFCAGPGDGRLGVDRPEGRVPKMDQGLYLWAYDVICEDRRPNDGYTGPGVAETARLEPAFVYRFPSRFKADPADIQSHGQSYYECDGFYRPKAMTADGSSLWFAWKPGAADAVELVHADDKGAKTFSLEVGKGAYGVDLWPKMSLSEIEGRRLITYFTGYARHRTRFIPDDVDAALKQIHGAEFADLSEKELELTRRQAPQAGIWHAELQPPRSPAEVAVFDVDRKTLKWTYNVSAHHPSIPANEFWTYLDKTAMVVAGRWAHISWVDLTATEATLRLITLDIAANQPNARAQTVPLGFDSLTNRRSALFDLIAADGVLYALVTQSDKLHIRDPRWENQLVVAIGNARRE